LAAWELCIFNRHFNSLFSYSIFSDEESDALEDNLLKSTGDYITESTTLPKGMIQLKRCTDANKQDSARVLSKYSSFIVTVEILHLQGHVHAVEFHPTAQVMLAAGMDQHLRLFQVLSRYVFFLRRESVMG
jgi:U3 small nucleolar RNA-associated protein 18